MIKIDGIDYRATWVEGVEQTVEITNGEGSGRLQNTYEMHLEYQGSFLNHTGQLRRDAECTDDEWFNLFITLSNPQNIHTIVFPFGVNGTITQTVYISTLSHQIKRWTANEIKYNRIIDVTLIATKPFWKAGETLKGVVL